MSTRGCALSFFPYYNVCTENMRPDVTTMYFLELQFGSFVTVGYF